MPRVAELDRGRFPAPDQLVAQLRAAGFGEPVTERLQQTRAVTREEAIERLRGRFISTLALVSDEELDEGIARAERELPERFEGTLDWLLVARRAPGLERAALGREPQPERHERRAGDPSTVRRTRGRRSTSPARATAIA